MLASVVIETNRASIFSNRIGLRMGGKESHARNEWFWEKHHPATPHFYLFVEIAVQLGFRKSDEAISLRIQNECLLVLMQLVVGDWISVFKTDSKLLP